MSKSKTGNLKKFANNDPISKMLEEVDEVSDLDVSDEISEDSNKELETEKKLIPRSISTTDNKDISMNDID